MGFIPFPRVLVLCEMQSVSSRFELVSSCPFPTTITVTPRAPQSFNSFRNIFIKFFLSKSFFPHVYILLFYIYHCFMYTIVLCIPLFYTYYCFMYTIVLYIPLFYVYHCFMYTIVLCIPLFYVYHCFIHTIVLCIPLFYVYHCFIHTIVLCIPLFYVYHCFIHTIVLCIPLFYTYYCFMYIIVLCIPLFYIVKQHIRLHKQEISSAPPKSSFFFRNSKPVATFVYHIYQPLRSGRIWHMVNFLSGL